MARQAFNWSLLDRDILYSMLYELKPEIVNRRLPIGEITSIISKHVKQHLPVKIRSYRHKPVKPGEIWVGGAYYSDDDKQGKNDLLKLS